MCIRDRVERARTMGITDPNKKYDMKELASGDVIVCATGVTDGGLLSGVRFGQDVIETETIVYRSITGTVRRIYGAVSYTHLDVYKRQAEDLAARVMAGGPRRILEIAAGTGALTQEMAARLDGASIVATDLNPAMLDLAAARFPGCLLYTSRCV